MEFLRYPVKYKRNEMLDWLSREADNVLYRWLKKFLSTGEGLPLNLHADDDSELDSFLSLFAPQTNPVAKELQRKVITKINAQSSYLLSTWEVIDGLEYLQKLLTIIGILGAKEAKPDVKALLTTDRISRFREYPHFSSCYEVAISVLLGMVEYNNMEEDVIELCLRDLYNPEVSLYCYRALCKSDIKYVLQHFIDMVRATAYLDNRLPAQAMRTIVSSCYNKSTFVEFIEQLINIIKEQDIVVMNRSFDVLMQALGRDDTIVIQAPHPIELITSGDVDQEYRRPLLLSSIPYKANYSNPKSVPVYTTISCIDNWDTRWVASLCRATGQANSCITQEGKNREYQQLALENSLALRSGVGLHG